MGATLSKMREVVLSQLQVKSNRNKTEQAADAFLLLVRVQAAKVSLAIHWRMKRNIIAARRMKLQLHCEKNGSSIDRHQRYALAAIELHLGQRHGLPSSESMNFGWPALYPPHKFAPKMILLSGQETHSLTEPVLYHKSSYWRR